MADIYVDSNATGGSQTGADWANAYLTLAAAAAVDAAGDTIWVASDHSESTASDVTLSWAGTQASPTRVICADKTSGAPPTTISTGASVATQTTSSITIANTGSVFVYGISFLSGTSTSNIVIVVNGGGGYVLLDTCDLYLVASGSASKINLTQSNGGVCVLKDCSVRFAAAAQTMRCNVASFIYVDGLTLASGGTSPTNLISSGPASTYMLINGLDLTNASSTINVVNETQRNQLFKFRNSKLPASWSGSLSAGTLGVGSEVVASNFAASDVNYEFSFANNFGTIVHETTLVKSGGASDGTTSISWEMATNADAEWSHQTLDSPEIVRWNETTGSSVTLTVDILHDSATNLQDDEVWLEVQYLGTSGFPLSSFIDDAAADYVATPVDQGSSSASWTTTGMSNPNEQKLSVTFTPQEAGYFIAKVKLAKASYTIYVDPKLQVSL